MEISRHIETQVRKRVAEFAGVPEAQIASDKCLVADYSICGDDAYELLEQLDRDLNAGIRDIPFSKHFPTEGEMSSGFRWMIKQLGWSRSIDDLTVNDLCKLLSDAISARR